MEIFIGKERLRRKKKERIKRKRNKKKKKIVSYNLKIHSLAQFPFKIAMIRKKTKSSKRRMKKESQNLFMH